MSKKDTPPEDQNKEGYEKGQDSRVIINLGDAVLTRIDRIRSTYGLTRAGMVRNWILEKLKEEERLRIDRKKEGFGAV